jgi:hypothetical protein
VINGYVEFQIYTEQANLCRIFMYTKLEEAPHQDQGAFVGATTSQAESL